MSGCKFATKGPLDSCDEYPFFKTKQGGAYKPWVSTRWVPAIENSTVGGFFGVIAKVLNKSRNKKFIVATSNSIPTAALPVK